MPIDKTNEVVLKQIKEKYGDQIDKYEYEVWKEAYLGRPPSGGFCTGMTRYRKCFKVSYVKLKDGTRIPVGSGCLIQILLIISIFIFIL